MRNIRRWLVLSAALLVLASGSACNVSASAQKSKRGVQDVSPRTPPKISTHPYYALVIGNNNYRYLPKLQTALNDAQALARLLREQYGFATTLLTDATRADILNALAIYRNNLPQDSNLLIYYAGHGKDDTDAKVAYWQPVDAQPTNNANWISSEDITAHLRVIKSLHVLVIADSCYSGALLLRGGSDPTSIYASVKPEERGYYISKLESIRSRNIMASGGKEPVADGGPEGHSIFAAVILHSLVEMNEDKFTAGALFQKIVVRVAGRSQQTPQYSAIVNSEHDGGDFVFYRQPGRPPPAPLCCSVMAPVETPDTSLISNTPHTDTSAQDIQDVLDQYRDAYQNKDVAALRKVWPGITPQNVKNLQIFFNSASSVSLNCTIVGAPQISADIATVNFVEELTYIADGRTKKLPIQKANMRLKKITDGTGQSWKIDSIQ
jgi:uncharacterized caspase-like protein